MAKLCAKGKAAAKRKFDVYPSAYANMYASAVCSGKVKGSIIPMHRGDRGFGYDPYFIPENNSKTFAEMAIEEKMILSHRFNAFKVLANQIL